MHHLEWADFTSSLSSLLQGHLLAVPLIMFCFFFFFMKESSFSYQVAGQQLYRLEMFMESSLPGLV